MPVPIAAAAAVAFLKGLQAFLGKKSKDKKAKEQNRASTAALTLTQKQREDQRRARLRAANSLLGGVPATTAGGGVNTNVGLDPALVADLDKERTYDFGSALPDSGTGSTYDFLSGLFGELGDTATRAFGSRTRKPANDEFELRPTGLAPNLAPPGGITRTPFASQAPGTIDINALLEEALGPGRK